MRMQMQCGKGDPLEKYCHWWYTDPGCRRARGMGSRGPKGGRVPPVAVVAGQCKQRHTVARESHELHAGRVPPLVAATLGCRRQKSGEGEQQEQ